ncbi:undecaprenyldiphospho-muramoylpentapeptide beta-N-acetylglucosaminyltransferase [Rhizobium sp. CFBP 8762]|uniref:undecaprenyldiphospho-muramoylpentapeptide beta-N-acetylglucosaminyltransferase n=1 Tax=Rhizobium sp. CFBP 8762 TaxID=2775279 RepID=UPI00177CAC94|nr:undecaprenyldiphospho-muramoylpentapeptide beta-N-acetylglucosaminyltransferase [Rhizobium sp. CFBP 8762]MBD8554820.1 undecaprenyldiphospho-muramoylpentapeptide beta-N-acetylglucosaminyltransferase [Rhizobium sp. CFBP 8762]
MTQGIILLAAGGTGGHLFPAEALAHELKTMGYAVHLVTDSRAERFAGKFPADDIHIVPSATISSKNPIKAARSLWTLWTGIRSARRLMAKLKPRVVIGFGGYPTIPPLLASTGMGIPSIIHEQNAVMGRANKALAGRVQAIAGGFLPEGQGNTAGKTLATGNPVRPAVLEAASQPYLPSSDGEEFRLVVFGGSQGAQYFSNAVPQAVCRLDDEARQRLRITQQARKEDQDKVAAQYTKLDIPADVSPFFTDMADRLAKAHLVVCRSGASTVSEISVIGRPAILVPYPYALDHDQAANAAALAATGGARVIAQSELTPERLSGIIAEAMNDPTGLATMARNARTSGKPDATHLLGELVDAIANGQTIAQFKETRS